MYIVGWKDCIDCHKYHSLHQDYTYIELQHNMVSPSPVVKQVVKAMQRLNFDGRLPVVLTDDLNIIINRDKLIQEMKIKLQHSTSGCSHCGNKR